MDRLNEIDVRKMLRGSLVREYEEVKAKYDKLSIKLRDIKDRIIKIANSIHSGVRVEFENLIKYIDDIEVKHTIRKTDGEIYIGV